ncbi:MAG: heavy-metal-associated domain-containing protein [Hyphomicrobiaceae bacterium]|nr:MAG: heavy-metal-associated domain-containing protein [Hyphomicrobiaceae bacterium]
MRSRGLPDTGWPPHVLSRTRCVVLLAVGALVAVGALEQGLGARALAAQPAAESAVKTVVIPVEGMACVACAASVKRALKTIDGVAAVEVNLEQRAARVTYMPGKVTPDRLVAAINKLGYRAGTPKEVE